MAGLGTLPQLIHPQHLPPQVTNTNPGMEDTAGRDTGPCPPTWSLSLCPGSVGPESHGLEQQESCSSAMA